MPSTYLCPASNATMDEGLPTRVRLFHHILDRFIFDSLFESDTSIESL